LSERSSDDQRYVVPSRVRRTLVTSLYLLFCVVIALFGGQYLFAENCIDKACMVKQVSDLGLYFDGLGVLLVVVAIQGVRSRLPGCQRQLKIDS
jgi:hypothetical protein